MKIAAASLIGILIVSIDFESVLGGDTAVDAKVKEECTRLVQNNMKRLLKEFSDCNREIKKKMNLNAEEHAKRLGCAVKCVLEKENFLDANGKITDEVMNNAIQKEGVPLKEYEDHVFKLFKECKTKFGDALNPEEVECRSYLEFGNCVHQVIAEYCEEHVGKVSW